MEALINLIKTTKYDIIIITETWITDKNNNKLLKELF